MKAWKSYKGDKMKYKMSAPCLLGVEGLVAQELRDMGAENVLPENGRVIFEGDESMLARANICSRYSERILVLLSTFEAHTFTELFDEVAKIPWEEYINRDDEFPVTGRSLSSDLHSVPDCQSIIKKSVVERLKKAYKLEWFPETAVKKQVRFLIMKDKVSIMLDTSGEGLHKRGYRKNSTEAPIRETLAACMANLARVRSDGNVYDPFCGSGTILIESAMLALNIAPGVRRSFDAEKWKNIPGKIWEKERERARDLVRSTSFHATGGDIDAEAVGLTQENAKKAGVAEYITAEKRDVASFDSSAQYGCVITNPPYGERLLDTTDAQEIYRTMGKVFEQKRGWSYSIISPDEDFEKIFGRRADKRRKLYNGMIKCQLYMYFKTK